MISTTRLESHSRKSSIAAGIFFIAASATAILGLKLYAPILESTNSLTEGYQRVKLGVLFELILCCSNIGTAITLFPFLQKFNKTLSVGYVCFRALEVVLILIGIASMLSLVSLSNEFYLDNQATNIVSFQTLSTLLKSAYYWMFMLGPNFMLGINTFLYSFVFYQSKLIPKPLAALGITGAILVFAVALLQMFGAVEQLSVLHLALSMPVALYEMILAAWLIIKGFDKTALRPSTQIV